MILFINKLQTVLISTCLLFSSISAQENDPETILQNVVLKFEEIKDYSADVRVKVDVSFLKIPDMDAKLYFKQPDKTRITSENFAMLPRQGFNFSPVNLLRKKHTSFFQKNELIGNVDAAVIKVIPLEESSDLIMSTLWIDTQNNIILKAEVSARPNGIFTVQFEYFTTESGYYMPRKMVFTFPANQMLFRKDIKDPMESEESKTDSNREKQETGKVIVEYSNYKINKGIPDDFFIDKKE